MVRLFNSRVNSKLIDPKPSIIRRYFTLAVAQELAMADKDINSWFSSSTVASTTYELGQIKEFAYATFDKIDRNGNGYLEYSELEIALTTPGRDAREKLFIQFLMENNDQIADSFDEGEQSMPDAISRHDLEAYFKLIIELLSPEPQQ